MKRFSKIILATVCVLYGSLAWGDVLPQYMSELEKPLFPEGDMLNVEFLKEDEVHKVNKSTKYVLRDTENTVVACIEIRSITPNYKFHIRPLESEDIKFMVASDDVDPALKAAYIDALFPDEKERWALELYGIRNSDKPAVPNGNNATYLSYAVVCPNHHRQVWQKIASTTQLNNSWQVTGEYNTFLKLLDKLISVAMKGQ